MANEQLTPVKYDPVTGMNTYKLATPGGDRDFTVPGVESWLKGRPIDQAFNESQRGYIDRRMQLLYHYYTEDNIPDPGFALDIAASNLPDKEMLRLMRYRTAAVDDPSSWSRMWKLPVFSQIKTVGTKWLPAPAQFVKHNTLDWFARNMTGNKNEDFFKLFTYSVARIDDVIAGRPVWNANEDGSLSPVEYVTGPDGKYVKRANGEVETNVTTIDDWMAKEGPWAQAFATGSDLLASFAYDPLMGLAKLSGARKAAGVLKAEEEVSGGLKGAVAGLKGKYGELIGRDPKKVQSMFGQISPKVAEVEDKARGLFVTSMSDMQRFMEGKLSWKDWWKGQKLTDIVRNSHSQSSSFQKLFEAIDRSKSPFEVKKLLGKIGKSANREFIDYLSRNTKAAGGKGAFEAYVDLFDESKRATLASEFASSYERAKQVETELNQMPKWARQAVYEFDGTPDATILSGDTPQWQHSGSFKHVPSGEDVIRRAALLEDESSFLHTRLSEMNEAMSAQAFVTRIPKATMTTNLRLWSEKNKGTPVFEDMFERRIGDGMKGIGKGVGRTLRGVGTMTPHPLINAGEDLAHEQFSRWLSELELTTQKQRPIREALGRGGVKQPWTSAQSQSYYDRFVKAEDDIARQMVMNEAERSVLTEHLGFSEIEADAVLRSHAGEYRKFVTYVNTRGKRVNYALSPGDVQVMTPIMPAHMIRRLAKVGTKTFASSEQKMAAVRYMMQRAYKTWKSLAVFRPAYVFRVVLLSEQPRLAMAGMPNFITHPILAMASSDLKGFSKVGGALLETKMKIPGLRSVTVFGKTSTESLNRVENVLKRIQEGGGSMAFVERTRAELGLGGLKPAEVMPGYDPTIPAAYEYANFPDEVSRKFYREGHLRGLNEILGFEDPVTRKWVMGERPGPDVKAWAMSPEGKRYRMTLGIEDKQVQTWLEDHFSRYKDWTKGLSQEQLNRLGSLSMDDLANIEPPASLPSTLWSNTLRRPGMVMPRDVVDRLMDRAWGTFISNPSFHVSRVGPWRDATMSEIDRAAAIANQQAVRATAEQRLVGGAKEITGIRDGFSVTEKWTPWFQDETVGGSISNQLRAVTIEHPYGASGRALAQGRDAARARFEETRDPAHALKAEELGRELRSYRVDDALKKYYAAGLNDTNMSKYRDVYAKMVNEHPELKAKTQEILRKAGVQGKVVIWRGHELGKHATFGEYINGSLDYQVAENFAFDRAWGNLSQADKQRLWEADSVIMDANVKVAQAREATEAADRALQSGNLTDPEAIAHVREQKVAYERELKDATAEWNKARAAKEKIHKQVIGDKLAVSRMVVDAKDIVAIGSTGELEMILPSHKAKVITQHHVSELKGNLGVDAEKVKSAAITGDTSKLNVSEKAVLERSYKIGFQQVKNVVYDLAESARVADLARFMFPFGNAWQEELTRWASLMWARPNMPVAMMDMWRHRQVLPFSYRDPRSGEDMYYVPGTAWLTKFATGSGWNPFTKGDDGLAMPLGGRMKNLFILTGGGGFMPGGGPWLQIGASAANRIVHLPTGLLNAIDPYAGRRSLADALLPSAFYRGYREISADQKSRQNAVTVNAAIAQELWKNGGDISKIDVTKIERQAKTLSIINAVAGLTVGSGVRANLPPKLQEMASYLHWAQVNFPEAAEKLWLEKYGEKAVAFMTNYTKNLTGEPPTREAEALFLNSEQMPLAQKYENVYWAVQAEAARGEYDPVAYASQIARGDREYREGDDFLNAAVTQTGWWRYGHLRDAFQQTVAANGWLPGSDQYRAARDMFESERDKLFAAYPAFQEEWLGSSQHEWQVNQQRLYRMIQEPGVDDSLQTVRAAKEYFDAQTAIKAKMDQLGLKSLVSKKALPMLQVWRAIAADIQRRYPDFQFVYTRLNLDNWSGRDDEMPLYGEQQ